MTKSRLLRVSMLVLATVLLARLIAHFGPATIVRQLMSVGARSVWLLVAYGIGTTIGALPWFVLLRRGQRPALGATIAGRFAASGVNAIVPLLGFGGEPVRLLWLRAEHRAAGTAAIVVDRLTYALASALFLAAGVVAALWLAPLPTTYVTTAAAGAGALLVAVALAIWLVARGRVAARVHRFVLRIGKRTPHEGPAFGEHVDAELASMLARRDHVALAIALGLAARFALGAEVVVGFWLLGYPLAPAEALVFAAVPVLLGFVGAIVPNQLGIQEGSQALVAAAIGLPPEVAISVVLLQRLRSVVTAAIALILVARQRGTSVRDPIATTPEAAA